MENFKDKKIEFEYIISNRGKHHFIYKSKEKVNYEEEIILEINNNIIKTKVNKYPIFNDEIIFSTMVKNEDNYIKQWITFHLNIGIDRIIIYDNAGIDDKLSYKSFYKKVNQINKNKKIKNLKFTQLIPKVFLLDKE